jgi:hypothetical protein
MVYKRISLYTNPNSWLIRRLITPTNESLYLIKQFLFNYLIEADCLKKHQLDPLYQQTEKLSAVLPAEVIVYCLSIIW